MIAKISLPNDTKQKFIDGMKVVNMIIIEELITIKEFFDSHPQFYDLAVKCNGNLLKYIDNQTSEICINAVKNRSEALKYVKEQTTEICIASVQNHGNALAYVKNQTPEICLAAVTARCRSNILHLVKDQTPEICIAAVSNSSDISPFDLESVKIFTPMETYKEICINSVKKHGRSLNLVKKQYLDQDSYREICTEAIKNYCNFNVLSNEDKTFDICMIAVSKCGDNLKYINSKTEMYIELCIIAVKNSINAFYYVDQNIEGIDLVCLEAVKKNGLLLKLVKNQSKEICLEAVKQNPLALQFVKDQIESDFKEICIEAMKKQCMPILCYIYIFFIFKLQYEN